VYRSARFAFSQLWGGWILRETSSITIKSREGAAEHVEKTV